MEVSNAKDACDNQSLSSQTENNLFSDIDCFKWQTKPGV